MGSRPVHHKRIPPFRPARPLRYDLHNFFGFRFVGERAHDAVEHEKGLLGVGVGGEQPVAQRVGVDPDTGDDFFLWFSVDAVACSRGADHVHPVCVSVEVLHMGDVHDPLRRCFQNVGHRLRHVVNCSRQVFKFGFGRRFLCKEKVYY